MKARHKMHRKGKASGGDIESPKSGSREWEEDLKDKPTRYTGGKPEDEAEEMKKGGRAKKKHVGKVDGEKAKMHAGRKPRKSGGRTGSNFSPLSSAHAGMKPKGRTDVEID